MSLSALNLKTVAACTPDNTGLQFWEAFAQFPKLIKLVIPMGEAPKQHQDWKFQTYISAASHPYTCNEMVTYS